MSRYDETVNEIQLMRVKTQVFTIHLRIGQDIKLDTNNDSTKTYILYKGINGRLYVDLYYGRTGDTECILTLDPKNIMYIVLGEENNKVLLDFE